MKLSKENIEKHGWILDKKRSIADLHYDLIQDIEYHLTIDDGNVSLDDVLLHIYVYYKNSSDKIFEGRIETNEEFNVLMKIMGFTPYQVLRKIEDARFTQYHLKDPALRN